jgi:tRNA-dihydrouridine synthase B
MLKIGNLKINSKAILAPMAGVTDLPYRLINRRLGCRFAFTEMLSARSVLYCTSGNTKRMMRSCDEDRPLGLQFMEYDENFLLKALEKISDHPCCLIDLNAACPAKNIIKNGAGAALMTDPPRFKRLITALVQNTTKPVTVKIRAGWDQNNINAVEIANIAEDSGACAIFIHGRTKTQKFRGEVNHDIIKDVKNSVGIPVIASGDIYTPKSAEKVIQNTGCDAVLVARGSYGNPWISSDIDNYLEQGKLSPRPAADEVALTMKKHLEMITDFYDEKYGLLMYRKNFIFYTKFFNFTKPLRRKVCQLTKKEHYLELIDDFKSNAVRHKEYYQQ